MLAELKSTLSRSPLVRRSYGRVRSLSDRRLAADLFLNPDTYLDALQHKAEGTVVLQLRDGLRIEIRRNLWDAEIVREMFVTQPYTRDVPLPVTPVVVDIGGYIGDFALYAVDRLKAERVVVYEPTAENLSILRRNIALNGYGDRITAVNKAVGSPGEVVLNVQALDAGETHASTYWYSDAEARRVPSVSLEALLDAHELDVVDLLKVDCEGGEYDIFLDATEQTLARVQNVALEWHEVDGHEPRLDAMRRALERAGFTLRQNRHIITATRTSDRPRAIAPS